MLHRPDGEKGLLFLFGVSGWFCQDGSVTLVLNFPVLEIGVSKQGTFQRPIAASIEGTLLLCITNSNSIIEQLSYNFKDALGDNYRHGQMTTYGY